MAFELGMRTGQDGSGRTVPTSRPDGKFLIVPSRCPVPTEKFWLSRPDVPSRRKFFRCPVPTSRPEGRAPALGSTSTTEQEEEVPPQKKKLVALEPTRHPGGEFQTHVYTKKAAEQKIFGENSTATANRTKPGGQ